MLATPDWAKSCRIFMATVDSAVASFLWADKPNSVPRLRPAQSLGSAQQVGDLIVLLPADE